MDITRHVKQYDTQMTGKQWELRNRIARVLLDHKATTISHTMPMGMLAKMTGLDGSSLRRMLEKAPGFVTVKTPTPTGLRTIGIFYDMRFLQWAVAIDNGAVYPPQLFELSKALLNEGLEVPMEVVLDKPTDAANAEPVAPDSELAAIFTGNNLAIEGTLIVPVSDKAAINYAEAVKLFSDNKLTAEQFLVHFVSRYVYNRKQATIS